MSKLLIDQVGKVFPARGKGQATRALMPTRALTLPRIDYGLIFLTLYYVPIRF